MGSAFRNICRGLDLPVAVSEIDCLVSRVRRWLTRGENTPIEG
jgi:hypothetical protein